VNAAMSLSVAPFPMPATPGQGGSVPEPGRSTTAAHPLETDCGDLPKAR
jgi:hypothetical protein